MKQRLLTTSGRPLLCRAQFAILGCAANWPHSASAQPLLAPKATQARVDEAQAKADGCMARAAQAGLTADQKTSDVGRRAAEAAATAGAASVVGALITGRVSDLLRAGAAGAAMGGTAGAVSARFNNDKANPVYRQFVQRCLSEKGFDVMGWK
jgi:outer membrane lipoprotein SlyB